MNLKADYNMSGVNLQVVHHEKDLGAIVGSDPNFHKHISTAVVKANQILGIIKNEITTTFDVPTLLDMPPPTLLHHYTYFTKFDLYL